MCGETDRQTDRIITYTNTCIWELLPKGSIWYIPRIVMPYIQALGHCKMEHITDVLSNIFWNDSFVRNLVYTPTTEPIRWLQSNSGPIRFDRHMCLFALCYNYFGPICYNVIISQQSSGVLISCNIVIIWWLNFKGCDLGTTHLYLIIHLCTRYYTKCGQCNLV